MPAACFHLHTPDGTAVAICMEGLLPMNQTAHFVTHDLAYHDYEGVALDHDERPRLQKDLGTRNHMLLRNHGTLTVGRSVASAFERMYHLERDCTMRVRTRMLGPTAYPIEKAVVDKGDSIFDNPDRARIALDLNPGAGRHCCASSGPHRSELPELKYFGLLVYYLVPTTSARPNRNAAQFRALRFLFLFEPAVFAL